MTFEARKHIPMDGSDAVIDFQVFGPNPKEVDKIDIGLVAAICIQIFFKKSFIREKFISVLTDSNTPIFPILSFSTL